MTAEPSDPVVLRHTPLDALHRRLKARMVPFAGYDMPVQYPTGIVAEHLWTRASASLFDVSHMGQIFLIGGNHAGVAAALGRLVPADIAGLGRGRMRYTQFTTSSGGIIDDLMVARPLAEAAEGRLHLVVNAARKAIDESWLKENLPPEIVLRVEQELALVALQGPLAVAVLAAHWPAVAELPFMGATSGTIAGIAVEASRSGYTGEDGFEISLAADRVEELCDMLLANERVRPAGLGARDSLRLEAGLPLYGHDIDESTSPLEAGLGWSVPQRRRQELSFIGSARIAEELAKGVVRRRVGLRPEGRAPAREGSRIVDGTGRETGLVTSGGYGPSVGGPIAMGYVATADAAPGTALNLSVRDKLLPAAVQRLPFVPHRYKR